MVLPESIRRSLIPAAPAPPRDRASDASDPTTARAVPPPAGRAQPTLDHPLCDPPPECGIALSPDGWLESARRCQPVCTRRERVLPLGARMPSTPPSRSAGTSGVAKYGRPHCQIRRVIGKSIQITQHNQRPPPARRETLPGVVGFRGRAERPGPGTGRAAGAGDGQSGRGRGRAERPGPGTGRAAGAGDGDGRASGQERAGTRPGLAGAGVGTGGRGIRDGRAA